jgi:hypothetical protein
MLAKTAEARGDFTMNTTGMHRPSSVIGKRLRKIFPILSVIVALGACFASPAAAQGHLQYFGYAYAGDNANDLAATYSYTNFTLTNGVYGESLVARVSAMHSKNVLAVIDLGQVVWIPNTAPGTPDVCPNNWNAEYCLPLNYVQRWQSWVQQNAAVLNSNYVLAFQVITEPDLFGIPQQDVDKATMLVKSTFPSIKTMLIEAGVCVVDDPAYHDRCTSQGKFPAGLRNSTSADWVGLDQYQVHPTTDPKFKAQMDALRKQKYTNQKIVYVMQGTWASNVDPAYGIPLSAMAGITTEWYQVAAADPDAAVLGVFLWPTCLSSDPNVVTKCSQDFPADVHAAQVAVGHKILYEGYLDQADCNVLAGWAWDRNLPNTAVTVDIYANGALKASGVLAGGYRADLAAAGKGNGYHAFVWTIPPELKNGATYWMSVDYGGTVVPLALSPKPIACPPPSVSVAWVKPAEVTWGPPGTLTVAGYAQNGTGGVTMSWRDATINSGWNVVAYVPPPDASHVWYNTIPNSNNCHTYQVQGNYSGVFSSVFTYTGVTSGYCHEAARVIWMQPQALAGFGPPGSIVLAGSATGAPAGTVINLWSRDVTAGTGWSNQGAALPNSSGIWYAAIQNANAAHLYSAYVTYDVIKSATCTYNGNNAISWCP